MELLLRPRSAWKGDEVVDVVEGDGGGGAVADDGGEFVQMVAVALGGIGAGIAAAEPIDKAADFGEHDGSLQQMKWVVREEQPFYLLEVFADGGQGVPTEVGSCFRSTIYTT